MVVLVVGLALIGLALSAWVLAYALDGDIAEETSREAGDVRGRFAAELPVPGRVEVDLDEGRQLVYAVVPHDPEVVPGQATDGLVVEVTDAQGEVVPPADPDGSTTSVFSRSETGFDLELVGQVDVPADGTYTVVVDGAPSGVVTTAGVVEAVPPHAGADAVLRSGALFVGGLLLGALGALVAFVGLIWLLTVRLTRRPQPVW